MHQIKGIKRWSLILMTMAVPLASSQPISLSQEALPFKFEARNPKFETNFKILKKQKENISDFKIRNSNFAVTGIASWYSETDPGINLHTANGEIFNDRKLTCASWYHDFGTLLEVKNLRNGKSVVCRVNDRGPHKRLGRLIDLTLTAFRRIADSRAGLIQVSVTKVSN